MKRYREKKLQEGFHQMDDLLSGFTFGELIETLQSNEAIIDERSVRKVFKELLNFRLEDARYELKKNMHQIIKESQI